jgi:tetratricopeptide (TPR) repeat protein
MNRKQRRAQARTAPKAASSSPTSAVLIRKLFDEALRHRQSGRLDEALGLCRRILAIESRHADALHLLGVIACQTGRHDLAVDLIGKAIDIDGTVAAYHSNRGIALADLGRPADALAAYDAALRIKPDFAEAHSNRGNVLRDLGRLDDAIAAYDAVIRISPDLADVHYNRGNALSDLGRLADALAAYEAALRLKPDFAEAHSNRGNALSDLDRFDDARAAYHAAISISPDHADAYCNLGNALRDVGRLDEAIAAYETAIRITPDHADAHLNLSLPLLLGGNLLAGWKNYEWRTRGSIGELRLWNLPKPQWRGESITGRKVLLYAEQGFGDTIQFCRYVPMVAAQGATVILAAPGPLMRLLSTLDGVSDVVVAGSPLPAFDVHCPLMSLPSVFGTTVDSIPARTPYLSAEPSVVDHMRNGLDGPGFKIGIAWRGNPNVKNGRKRSVGVELFTRLFATAPEGVVFVSLQKETTAEEKMLLHRFPCVLDKSDAIGDFADTAAMICNLDLIISVDTSVAHLAGALGRRTWVLLPVVPDWRWMMGRDDSPWYPSVRLFRQTKRGDWGTVIDRVATALDQDYERTRTGAGRDVHAWE